MCISEFLNFSQLIYTHIYICLRNIKMIYHGLDYCGSFGNKELHRALQTSISKEHNPGMSGFTRKMSARISYF